jgi:hypothetical protein
LGCNGGTNANCIKCTYGYFNVSGYCLNSCPPKTAPIFANQTCGC